MPDKQQDPPVEERTAAVAAPTTMTRAEVRAENDLAEMERDIARRRAELMAKRLEASRIDPNDLYPAPERTTRADQTIPGGLYIVPEVRPDGQVIGARVVNANGEPIDPRALKR